MLDSEWKSKIHTVILKDEALQNILNVTISLPLRVSEFKEKSVIILGELNISFPISHPI